MTKLLLAIILLSAAFTCPAQQDSVRKYLDADLNFTTRKNFVYAAMAVKADDHWMLYAVYPDTSVLLKVLFKDAALTVKDGPFTLFYPKGVVAQKGNFKDNIASGHWQSYYSSGQIRNEGEIIKNHLSGVWKAWYENGALMSTKTYLYTETPGAGEAVHESSPINKVQRVLDAFTPEGTPEGSATTWYSTGVKESEVNYHNDSLSGSCTWYRPNGQPSSKEVYTNGKVTELACYDEEGKYTGSTCSILKLPVLIHPVYTAEDYIINELHREKHRDIKNYGEANVAFTVTDKGKAEKLVITNSPDAALSRHITEIFARMPAWSPAVTHNRKESFPMTLVIPYYGD